MALKEAKIGGYVVNSEDDAKKALQMRVELKDGIAEELQQIEELGQAVAGWMKNNDVKQISIEGGHGTLIQRYNPNKWDGDVLLELVKKAKPKSWKRIWQALTSRQPDPDKIQQAVKEGLIALPKIEDAYVMGAPQRPFVTFYRDE